MFRNGPRVHVLPLRLSFCTVAGEKERKYGVIQNQLCSARAYNANFYFFGKFSVTLAEDFSPPRIPPFSLNISLYVCLSPDEGAASKAALLSYRSVSLENVNCSTD